MNCLGPSISRISCLNSRTIFQTCSKVDSLAARLTKQHARPFAIATSRCASRIPNRIEPSRRSSRAPAPSSKSRILRKTTATQQRIITDFEELPSNYDPEDGLRFRESLLSQREVTAIFGKGVTAETANHVLLILHGQRVAGTLEEPFDYTEPFARGLINKGLEWLRENVPVDEIANAGMRADQELAAMEAETVADAERIGLYVPNASRRDGESPYAKGALETVREERKKALDEKEAREKSQADEIIENSGPLITTPESRQWSQVELRRPGENPKLKYYLETAYADFPEEIPQMSKLRRLLPAALVTLGTVLGSVVFAMVYEPPKNSARLFPDIPPSAATIIGLVLMNFAVLTAWRMPPLFRFLNKYFIVMPGYPFSFSLVGSNFSHIQFSHFARNMVILWFMGTRLHDEIGRGQFLALYMASGAIGSFVSLTSFVLAANFMTSSLGASGAICGVIACYLSLSPWDKVQFFGIFPPENWPSISAIVVLAFMVGGELFSALWRVKKLGIDHWAHLGGYFGGIAGAQIIIARHDAGMKRRRERETWNRK